MNLRSMIACMAAAPILMAGAPQPVRLQPSSPWDVDYAENSCRLIRTFGGGKSTVKLALESAAPGHLDMLAVGKPLANNVEEVQARFLPVQVAPMKGRTARATKTGEPAILWSTVFLLPDDLAAAVKKDWDERKANRGVRPRPFNLGEEFVKRSQRYDFASKATELEIETRRNRPIILETGPLGEAIKKFDECGRDSLRDWGVDPDLEDKIVRPVWTPDQSRWFTSSDYPPAMLDKYAESEVSARLLVDATGKVTSCTSLSHFDAPEFNKVVCDRLKARARFEPAELADGTKVPSYYTLRVNFRIAH